MVKAETQKPFDLLRRDGRKKMFLTIDTETAGDIEKGENAVYDLGFAVHDKQGNIYYKRNFIIEEVFNDTELMNSAYYARKIPLYYEMLANGTAELVPLEKAISFLVKLVHEYNVSTVCAYNLIFDSKALMYTLKTYLPKKYGRLGWKSPFAFFRYAILNKKEIEFTCIYNLACQLLATQNTFVKVAIKQNNIMEKYDWISKAKNLRTNAQVMNRYITGDYQFMEAHTALADVEIEIEILAKCLRQKKAYSRKIIAFPWRIPQANFKRIRETLAS